MFSVAKAEHAPSMVCAEGEGQTSCLVATTSCGISTGILASIHMNTHTSRAQRV